LSGFGYPSAPLPLALNIASKILAFVTALTLFLPQWSLAGRAPGEAAVAGQPGRDDHRYDGEQQHRDHHDVDFRQVLPEPDRAEDPQRQRVLRSRVIASNTVRFLPGEIAPPGEPAGAPAGPLP